MTGTFAAQRDAAACATTADQAIAYQSNLGRRAALALLLHPSATTEDVHRVICGSVERQALLAGCGRVTVELTRCEQAAAVLGVSR